MSVSPKRSLIENILAASMTFLLLALIVVSPANADAPRCENNFPDLVSDNRQRREMAERMALNAPIQGSAADIMKVAMLRVDEALRAGGFGSRMLLQVHDELVIEVAPGDLVTVLDAAVAEVARP